MKEQQNSPLVGVIMGSKSDWPTMQEAVAILEEFAIPYEAKVVSAHRMPDDMAEYGRTAHERGIRVIIAGAGGAAHLPGMIAAYSPLPIIGVPIKSSSLNGLDSLLSIVQMPGGVPVATVAIGGGKNAGLLAAQIAGVADEEIIRKLLSYKESLRSMARLQNDDILSKS